MFCGVLPVQLCRLFADVRRQMRGTFLQCLLAKRRNARNVLLMNAMLWQNQLKHVHKVSVSVSSCRERGPRLVCDEAAGLWCLLRGFGCPSGSLPASRQLGQMCHGELLGLRREQFDGVRASRRCSA